MRIQKAKEQFIRGYFSTCERSGKTVDAYRCDLGGFIEHLGKNMDITQIAPENIEQWATKLKNGGYASASIRRKLATLRTFFNYWVRRRVVERSPIWQLRLDLGAQAPLPKSLSMDEMGRMIREARDKQLEFPVNGACHVTGGFLALRNQAIVELMLATGIRVGEASSLTVSDISAEAGRLQILGKGNRERLAFVTDGHCRRVLVKYIEKRRQIGTGHESLFINVCGRPITTQGVACVIRRLAAGAGIQKHITPHMIRHTSATFLLSDCGNLRIVQEFLGHASIVTTQRYTHVTKEQLLTTLKEHYPGRMIRR